MQPPQPPYGQPPPPGGYGPPPGPPPGPPGWGPPPGPPSRPPNNGGPVIILAIVGVLVVIGVITGVYFVVAGDDDDHRTTPVAVPTDVPSYSYTPPTPTYTPYSPPNTYSPPPTYSAWTPEPGDCVRNSGTYSKPILHKSTCSSGNYRVLRRYNGTTNVYRCEVPNRTWYGVWYTNPEFVVCLRKL